MNKKVQILAMTDDLVDKKVKIQGTKYDRKRKISDATIRKMKSMIARNYTVSQVAAALGVAYQSVKYHTDPVWRATYNANRDGSHTGKDHISIRNRVAYKRTLIAEGKLPA